MFFTLSGLLLLGLVLMVLSRAIIGPTSIDRVIAVNVVGTKTTVLLIIIGYIFHRVEMFVDIAIGYALLNFIVSIAAVRYFQKHG